MGLGGKEEAEVGSGGSFLTAIDYTTGKIAWKRPYYGEGGGGGLLTTAGKLLFAGDGAGNLVAHDVAEGKPLWHTRIGDVTNAPQTFMLDGHQYLIAATGDTLWRSCSIDRSEPCLVQPTFHRWVAKGYCFRFTHDCRNLINAASRLKSRLRARLPALTRFVAYGPIS
jgi:hypothetical protein